MAIKINEPFAYRDGSGPVKSLLGVAINGTGTFLKRPGIPGRLVLASLDRQVRPRTDGLPEWLAYESHLAAIYKSSEVRRHIIKVENGGTPIVAGVDGAELVMDVGVKRSLYKAGPSHLATIAGNVFGNTPQAADTGGSLDNYIELTKSSLIGSGIVNGGIAEVARGTVANNHPLFSLNGGNMYTPLMYYKFYNTHGSSFTDKGLVDQFLLYYEIGYTLVLVSIDGTKQSAPHAAGEQYAVLKFRHHVEFPYACISVKYCLALSVPDVYAGAQVSADYWCTVNDVSVKRPAAVSGHVAYGTGDYAKMWKQAPGNLWWRPAASENILNLVTTTSYITAPSIGFDISYNVEHHWVPGKAYGTNGANAAIGTRPFGFSKPVVTTEHMPSWPGIASGEDAKRLAAVSFLETGKATTLVGYDMSSTALAQLRYRVTWPLPAPVNLIDAVDHELIKDLAGKWRSSDLIVALEGVELQAASSLAGLKAELAANPRVFLSYCSDNSFRVPTGVVYLTEPAQTADEEGFDIDDEVLLAKDPDDPESKDVTFKQADKLCGDWHAMGLQKAIVVPGPATGFSPNALTTGWAFTMWEGSVRAVMWSMINSVATPSRVLSDSELSAAYVALQAGLRPPVLAPVASNAEYLTYLESNPNTGISAIGNFCCLKVFGKTWPEITRSTTAQATASKWCADGNSEDGFLRHPNLWSPEFWTVTGAGKSYRAAGLVGSLLTNPFGFGTIGTMGHSNG